MQVASSINAGDYGTHVDHKPKHYEGEIIEDHRLFDFEQEGDY